MYRLNLEIGRYMKPYQVDVGGDDMTTAGGGALQGGINTGSVNTVAIAEDSHNLLAFGTSIGTVEFWDPRSKARIGISQAKKEKSRRLTLIDQVYPLRLGPQRDWFRYSTFDGLCRFYEKTKAMATQSRR